METVLKSVTHHRTGVPNFSSIGRGETTVVIIVRKDATAMLVVVEGGTATFTIVKEGGDSDAEVGEPPVIGLMFLMLRR